MAVPVYIQLYEEFQNVNFFEVDIEANKTIPPLKKSPLYQHLNSTQTKYVVTMTIAIVKGFS